MNQSFLQQKIASTFIKTKKYVSIFSGRNFQALDLNFPSMAELKTKKNDASVTDFINTVENEQKRQDSFELLKIFEEVTGDPAMMWGDSIIGFGQYHYKSERSSQEGDWMLTGFSPRKQNISLYIMSGMCGWEPFEKFFAKLGKHKRSKGCCVYIKKLADIDVSVLKKIIKKSGEEMQKMYPAQ